MFIKTTYLIILLGWFLYTEAQTTRKVDEIKTILRVKIDGYIQEEAWKNASAIDSFVQQRPVLKKRKIFSQGPRYGYFMMMMPFMFQVFVRKEKEIPFQQN